MKNLKLLKEELTIGVVALLAFVAVHFSIKAIFPNTLVFDLMSEIEFVFFATVKVSLLIMLTYWVVRVAFPEVYRYYKDNIYQDFKNYSSDHRFYITVGVILAIFLALNYQAHAGDCKYSSEQSLRVALVDQLESQVGVREATGKNDGVEVERYLASVGLGKGYAWCVAYVAYNLQAFNVDNPNSAWSPHYANRKDMVWYKGKRLKSEPSPGDVFTIYSSHRKRVAHGGFYIGTDRSSGYFITIEGNTNDGGSREGIGVFKRKRNPLKVYAITNYITPSYESTCSNSIRVDSDRLQNGRTNREYDRERLDIYRNAPYTQGGNSYSTGGGVEPTSVDSDRFDWPNQLGYTNGIQWTLHCLCIDTRWCIDSTSQLRGAGGQNTVPGEAAQDISSLDQRQGRSSKGGTQSATEVGLLFTWNQPTDSCITGHLVGLKIS